MYATGSDNWNDITSEFGRFAPREVLVGGGAISADSLQSFLKERLEALIEPMPEECFEAQRSAERIQEHFKVQDFDAAGPDRPAVHCAVPRRSVGLSSSRRRRPAFPV